MGSQNVDYCSMVVYIFFQILSSLRLFEMVGKGVQHGKLGTNKVGITMVSLILVFYCFGVYYAFLAYREFKGIHKDRGVVMRSGVSQYTAPAGGGSV